jgi:dTMP kinase
MKQHVEFDIDFRRNPYKGKYVVIEGIDGSGKTTQAKLVSEALRVKGLTVLEISEPNTHDAIGKLVREVLSSKIKVSSVAIQYLFSANRATTHEEIIIPALERGETVLSHRCFWSAVAYGIVDRHAEGDVEQAGNQLLIAQSILSMYHQFIIPDYTFYLDISIDTAMSRLSGMDKPKEIYEKRETLENIKKGYEWLLEKFPSEFTVINGEQAVEKITERIVSGIGYRV